MSPDTPDVTPPNASAESPASAPAPEGGDVAAPAPKKPRAPRKTAPKAAAPAAEVAEAPAEASVVAPVEASVAPAGDEVAAPKPAPRKRTRKAVEASDAAEVEVAAPAPVAVAVEAPRVVEAPVAAPHVAEPRAEAPAAESRDEAPASAAPSRADADSDEGGDGEGGDGVSAEGEDGAQDGESRRSRSRRRRRGRRGGSDDAPRVEGAEGAPGDEEAAAGAEGAPRPPRPERAPRPVGPVVEFSTADAGETFAGVMSGDFDVAAEIVEGEPSIPAKRVLAAEPDAPKLHKVLAQSGIGSRRDMEQLITDGKVTVNGEVAHTGQRISFGDEVRVAGRVVKLRIAPPPARVIAYHKPAGEVVTMDDPEKRPTVFRRLPRLAHGKWQSVGRLDINTEGLLLFTNSGDLANKLMHPRFGVEREYAARVLGTLETEAREKLLTGVTIDGQPAQFKSIEDGGGEGVNRWYRVVITEGRNREVRKLFDAVGMAVSRLIRIRYGSVVLPKGLKRGVWVDLDENDVRRLRQLAGSDQPQRGERPEGQQQQPRGDGGQPRNDRGPRNDGGPRKDNGPRNDNGPRGQQSKGRNDRNDRGNRGRERDRERGPSSNNNSPAPFREPGDPSFIPNPLQQTFDRRAIQQRERPLSVADDFDEDGPIGPIPNPLQQTYDKRGVQGNRSPFAGKGGKGKGGGGGGGGGEKQPDPLQTAVGYIGADAFVKKLHSRGGGGGRGRR